MTADELPQDELDNAKGLLEFQVHRLPGILDDPGVEEWQNKILEVIHYTAVRIGESYPLEVPNIQGFVMGEIVRIKEEEEAQEAKKTRKKKAESHSVQWLRLIAQDIGQYLVPNPEHVWLSYESSPVEE